MPYEINVSKHGQHVFATHPRSLNNLLEVEAIALLKDFRKRFPRTEGWECSLQSLRTHGEYIHVPEEHKLVDVPGMEGLAQCTVCNGAEGELPTECPGVKMSIGQRELVLEGKLNYHHGKWQDTTNKVGKS